MAFGLSNILGGLGKFWNTWGSTILEVGTTAYGFYQGYKNQKAAKKAQEGAMGMAQPPRMGTYGQYSPEALAWLEGRMPAAGQRSVEPPGYPTSLMETRGLAQAAYAKPMPSVEQLAAWANQTYDQATDAAIKQALPAIEKLIGPKMVYHGAAPMETMSQLMEKYIPYKERAAAVEKAPQISNLMQMQMMDRANTLWNMYQSGDIDERKLQAEYVKMNELFNTEWAKMGLQTFGQGGGAMQGWSPESSLLYQGTPMGKTLGAGDIGDWAKILKGFGGTFSEMLNSWGDKDKKPGELPETTIT